MSVENESEAPYVAPKPVKWVATLLSYVAHPLFLPTFFYYWLIQRFPVEFPGLEGKMLQLRLIGVFVTTAFLPGIAVFLMWRLKFISGIRLKTQKDRIVPYIIIMIFYWWMWYLSKNFKDQPAVLKFFFLGIFLTTVGGLSFNNFEKISMHAMGVAGVLTGVLLTCFYYKTHLGADVSIVMIVAGAVCSARLILNDHSTREVYLGFFVGAACQLIGYFVSFLW
ncbi:hypothetical protein FLA_5545 [Filimonas lacunae]|nr:hypothetical protein FLA_5545 [Filimonas lacunae]